MWKELPPAARGWNGAIGAITTYRRFSCLLRQVIGGRQGKVGKGHCGHWLGAPGSTDYFVTRFSK